MLGLRSALLVALPVVMLLSALLSWWSFRAYPNSLFSEFDEASTIYFLSDLANFAAINKPQHLGFLSRRLYCHVV